MKRKPTDKAGKRKPDSRNAVPEISPVNDPVGHLVLPAHVKKIQTAIDKIAKSDGVLVLNDAVDLATIFIIMTHKDSKQIKEIRFKNWLKLDLDKAKKTYAKNILTFRKIFRTEIPDFIFELNQYHETMKELVCGSGRYFTECDIQGFQTLDCGIFKHVFTDRKPEEKDALSLRYMHHSLNYFPIFSYGSDSVTQGLIFDYQENAFSPFIGFVGDGDYYAKNGVWDCLRKAFDGYDDDDLYFEFENFDYEELNELLEEDSYVLLGLFYKLVTNGYLNFHNCLSIKPDVVSRLRFDSFLSDSQLKKLSKRSTFFVAEEYNIYPRHPIKIEGNFNDIFSYDVLASFLEMFGLLGGTNHIRNFIIQMEKSGVDILETMGLNAKVWQSKKEISTQDENVFLNAVEKFCNDEADAGRPYLSYLVGLHAWESAKKPMTNLSARLLQRVPDEICHPIIKMVARQHAETRFDKSILI